MWFSFIFTRSPQILQSIPNMTKLIPILNLHIKPVHVPKYYYQHVIGQKFSKRLRKLNFLSQLCWYWRPTFLIQRASWASAHQPWISVSLCSICRHAERLMVSFTVWTQNEAGELTPLTPKLYFWPTNQLCLSREARTLFFITNQSFILVRLKLCSVQL